MRWLGNLFCVAFMLFASVAAATAGGRVALVIGNGDYRLVEPLDGAKDDAEDVAVMLETVGFDVVRGFNISKGRFRSVLTDFTRRLNDADVALFYYAGQGLQSEGRNYLLPIDAEIRSLTDLVFDAVPVMEVARLMQRSARSSVVLLECCQASPIAAKGASASLSFKLDGFAAEPVSEDTFVAMAAEPNRLTAIASGERRPFTQSLIRHLKVPGKDIEESLKAVEAEVASATGGKQNPWVKNALGRSLAINNATATSETAQTTSTSDAISEQADWEEILESDNPDDFAEFLAKHPSGVFASTARAQLKRLGRTPAVSADGESKGGRDGMSAKSSTATSSDTNTNLRPPETKLTPTELARSTEKELVRLGCFSGEPDGNWSQESANGLKKYASIRRLRNMVAEPDEKILHQLRGEDERVCTLSCGKGTVEADGQCVAVTCRNGQQLNSDGKCVEIKETSKPKVVKAEPNAEKPAKKVRAEKPARSERNTASPPVVKKAPPAPVSDGCPRGAKRNKNGLCYFSPFCSAANKGLPGTDQCE